jgi:hypothetical protein
MRLRLHLPCVLLALATAACGGGSDSSDGAVGTPADTMPLELGPNDMLITNTDSAVDLALIGDHVIMKFSPRVAAKVRAGLDTAKVDTSSAFGSMIARTVKKSVGALLDKRIDYPLSDIESVKYQDGRIEFAYRKKHSLSFESVKVDRDRPVLASFPDSDARRFVATLEKRLKR